MLAITRSLGGEQQYSDGGGIIGGGLRIKGHMVMRSDEDGRREKAVVYRL
jgi:hypothetical protein